MAGRIRKRHVEAPDGTRWTVERHWLARRPRYLGYRFRLKRRHRHWEPPFPAADERPEIHRPQPAGPVSRPYRDNADLARRDRRRRRRSDGGGWWLGDWNLGGWGRGSGRSSGGGLFGRGGGIARGGGSRGASGGGSRLSSSGGGSRGGGNGGGWLDDVDDAIAWILIIIAVIAVALITIFVLAPAALFLAEYLLFWLLVGGWISYNTLTGRPWVVKATRDGYESPDYAYRVKGWRNSQALIDDLADDLRRGEPPVPSEVAVAVELIQD